ncbi:MAG TPA: ATP-binding protein, partial [Candidatus Didemnitutus sp.]|nr:ATP-binding protein [Candidatus Didemnitutus sp.]
SQLHGRTLDEFRADTVTGELRTRIAATVAEGNSWRGQLANRLGDGRIVQVRTSVSPIYGPDGQIKHHLVLEEDITESLAEQARRRQLEAQLQQAQKMESIGTLAGGIAHDFNNILTGILGFCDLTRLAAKDDPEVLEGLAEISAAGRRARDLVAQILTFSRKRQANPVPIELYRIVSESLKLIRASTPATVEIVSRLERGMIMADPSQIHQVVVNLCTNAVHAIGARKDGRLEVTIQHVAADAAPAAPGTPSRGSLCLRVADNGTGMDATTLERIFDPFFTTKPAGEGTGLGLSIVQGVVASFGGSITVRSTPGVGSTFELFFPPCVDQPAAPTERPPVVPGRGQRVMVVDDETMVTDFVAAALRQFQYTPELFNDPRKALEAFTADPGRYDGILTDLTMPRLTGLDLLHEFRSLRPEVPVIITTGYGHQLTPEKLDAIPRCTVLPKPFSSEDLARVLGTMLGEAASANSSMLNVHRS